MITTAIPHILIVDDDPVIVKVLDIIFKNIGFDTSFAYSAKEALYQSMEIKPDLIILDVNLPDGDGFMVCSLLMKMPGTAGTPVIFLSASNDSESIVQGFEAGGVDYISKLANHTEIIARVNNHLRLKNAYDSMTKLNAEKLQKLAYAQNLILPNPLDYPDDKFSVIIKEINHAGGDFYDVIKVGNQVTDYIVADVSGHDLDASFWTAGLKTLLHEYAKAYNTPLDIVRSINKSLQKIIPEGLFFSMVYARLNTVNNHLEIVTGGHPPVIIVSAVQKVQIIKLQGDVVGAFLDAEFETAKIKLNSGDKIIIYTDGLLEINKNINEEVERLAELCERHKNLDLSLMLEAVKSDSRVESYIDDDILILGISCK